MDTPDLSSLDRRVLTLELELTHSLKRIDASEKRIESLQGDHELVVEKINRSILYVAVAALALVFNIIKSRIGM